MKVNRGGQGQGAGPPFNLGAHPSLQLAGVQQLTGRVPLRGGWGCGAEAMITLIIYTYTRVCDVRGRRGTVVPPSTNMHLSKI